MGAGGKCSLHLSSSDYMWIYAWSNRIGREVFPERCYELLLRISPPETSTEFLRNTYYKISSVINNCISNIYDKYFFNSLDMFSLYKTKFILIQLTICHFNCSYSSSSSSSSNITSYSIVFIFDINTLTISLSLQMGKS